jgi:hypothetical protein
MSAKSTRPGTPMRQWINDSYSSDGRSWPSTGDTQDHNGGVGLDGSSKTNHGGPSDHDLYGKGVNGAPNLEGRERRCVQGPQPGPRRR